MTKRFKTGQGRHKAEIARVSVDDGQTRFNVKFENLDHAVWPAAKLPPDIVPPPDCWLDEEVELELYEEAGSTVNFVCHGMDENDYVALCGRLYKQARGDCEKGE